jgi:eukaryotic-like serine/threonine-protein kinase
MEPETPDPSEGDTRTRDGSDAPMAERRIGPYRLLKELGHGGFGVVYLAARADEAYHKRVAIKVLRVGIGNAEAFRHFRRERQILAVLEHPNIARLLEGGTTDDGLPYLVMEYVQGQPIDSYCDGRRLPIAGRLRLFREICSAVSFAHRNLIVHRDLKPGNILVAPEGVPKLLDFGIAKLLQPELSGEAPTATGFAMTPEYASPEQVRGQGVTTASDVYALGVVLYELLTGHRPYRLKSRQTLEVLKAVCDEEPQKPSIVVTRSEEGIEGRASITPEGVGGARDLSPERLGRRLSGDLDNIVLMALRKEPHRRYGSVEALSEDIACYLQERPVLARKGTAAYRAGKYVRRHALGVAVAVGFVLLLGGFSVAMAIQSRHLARERDHAAQERDKAEKVSSFLVDLFKVSDPSEAKGNTVTAREILDKGAERIRGELKDKPEVQATLMHTMGQVYKSLGLYDKAEGLLSSALEIQKGVFGPEHPDVAESMKGLGETLTDEGRARVAESLLRDALAIRSKVLPKGHPDIAESRSALGGCLIQLQRYGEAESLLLEGYPILSAKRSERSPATQETRRRLIALYQAWGKPEKAASYRAAPAIVR